MAVFSLDPTFFQNLKVYIQNITNSKQILTSSPCPKQSFFPFMSENLFEVHFSFLVEGAIVNRPK